MLGRISILVLSLAGVLGLSACERDRGRERRETTPAETRTRSGEVTGEAPRVEPERPPSVEPRAANAAASDPRFDAGRLSIIGSTEELHRNLGLLAADAAVTPALAPAPTLASPPQVGAGAVESPPPPTHREGAGRPGAGGDPYQ